MSTSRLFEGGVVNIKYSRFPELVEAWLKDNPERTMTSGELGSLLDETVKDILYFSHTVWRVWEDLGRPTAQTVGIMPKFKTLAEAVRYETTFELRSRMWGPAIKLLSEYGITLHYEQVPERHSLSDYLAYS